VKEYTLAASGWTEIKATPAEVKAAAKAETGFYLGFALRQLHTANAAQWAALELYFNGLSAFLGN
ncbi:MAG: hypothetical protein IJB97_03850, partial [Clostridia bacterium]|nr:hypothetical protein [Clostridia bacterium]